MAIGKERNEILSVKLKRVGFGLDGIIYTIKNQPGINVVGQDQKT